MKDYLSEGVYGGGIFSHSSFMHVPHIFYRVEIWSESWPGDDVDINYVNNPEQLRQRVSGYCSAAEGTLPINDANGTIRLQ